MKNSTYLTIFYKISISSSSTKRVDKYEKCYSMLCK